MAKGQCHICGLEKELTFEHVPPKSTFNKTTRYVSTSLEDLVKIDNPLVQLPKGKIEQGGMGFYSLCEDCNNFLGRSYVNAYRKWVQAGVEILQDGAIAHQLYKLVNQEPRKILKQIVSMFLSLNDTWYLREYPELAEFVRDPDSNDLPAKYRIFTYLNSEGKIRYSRHSTAYIGSLGVVNVSEITFAPFGFVLTMGFDGQISNLTEITSFKTQNVNAPVELTASFVKLPTYLPMPLDYRSRTQIEEDIKKGIEIKQKLQDEYGFG